MPYALADEWFAWKLNSVSISFQRQMMGKDKVVKKSDDKALDDTKMTQSPTTRSRKLKDITETPAASSSKGDKHKKKHKKKSGDLDAPKGSSHRSSSRASEKSGGETPQQPPAKKSRGLDIPSLIFEIRRRVANKEDAASIAKDMPVTNMSWNELLVTKHASTLDVAFTAKHIKAC